MPEARAVRGCRPRAPPNLPTPTYLLFVGWEKLLSILPEDPLSEWPSESSVAACTVAHDVKDIL